jgi:hypothetical protein
VSYLLELILRYGEAKYTSAVDAATIAERLAAFREADLLLNQIIDALRGTSDGGPQ